MHPKSKNQKLYQRPWFVIGLIGFLIAVSVSLFAIKSYFDIPRLGPKLEYIGQSQYGGCFLLLCEGLPITEYYFATEMSEEEVKGYFGGAQYITPTPPINTDDRFKRHNMPFDLSSNGARFIVSYYYDPSFILRLYRLRKANKPYVIGVQDKYFPLAEQAQR